MDSSSLVEPKPGVTPAPETPAATPDSAQAPSGSIPGLPDELLHTPAIQALIAGTPPAVSASVKEFETNPIAKLIIENKDDLLRAGMGFYRSLSGDIGVIFNQFHIHPSDLQAADKAGKLAQVAPSFDALNAEVAKSGPNNPVLSATAVPGGPKPASLPTPPQVASGTTAPAPASTAPPSNVAPATAKIQSQIMGSRAKNVAQGGPTTGPVPGQGRILNNILKPVV
jgi:hypothetical protein